MAEKTHKESSLLSHDENLKILLLIESNCLSLSTSVAQLYATEQPPQTQWIKRGVLCLIQNCDTQTYILRLYCPVYECLLWEQEIDATITIKRVRPDFITFEGHINMAAIKFASITEAQDLYDNVSEYVYRNEESVRHQSGIFNAFPINAERIRFIDEFMQGNIEAETECVNDHSNNINNLEATQNSAKQIDYNSVFWQNRSRAKFKTGLYKEDIGKPLNFVHLAHIGSGQDQGSNRANNKTVNNFFIATDVYDAYSTDQELKTFIDNFVKQNNTAEADHLRPSRISASEEEVNQLINLLESNTQISQQTAEPDQLVYKSMLSQNRRAHCRTGLQKHDISNPQNFVHVSHIGFEPARVSLRDENQFVGTSSDGRERCSLIDEFNQQNNVIDDVTPLYKDDQNETEKPDYKTQTEDKLILQRRFGLSKDDISSPSHFVHVAHVGFGKVHGFGETKIVDNFIMTTEVYDNLKTDQEVKSFENNFVPLMDVIDEGQIEESVVATVSTLPESEVILVEEPRPAAQHDTGRPSSQTNVNPPIKSSRSRAQSRTGLTKQDISSPFNFVHVTHVGFARNPSVSGANSDIIKFLKSPGVYDAYTTDPVTKDFIDEFMQKNNVIDKLKSEYENDSNATMEHMQTEDDHIES